MSAVNFLLWGGKKQSSGCGLKFAEYLKNSGRLRCSFRDQNKPSYYYEKRFPILYISQYYIYRINFRQRGCNLDARNVIATSHAAHRSGRTQWSPRRSHFIAPISRISMTNTSSQRSETRLQSTTPRSRFGIANCVGHRETRLFELFPTMCAASADLPGIPT